MKSGFDTRLDSSDEDSSDSDRDSLTRRAFNQGQVYYSCLGKQVHVYSTEVTGEVEVSTVM